MGAKQRHRNLTIVVGRRYRMRTGCVVKIVSRRPGTFPFFAGVVMTGPDAGRGLTWDVEGRRYQAKDAPEDLMEACRGRE